MIRLPCLWSSAVLLGCLFLLTGCAVVETKVTRFHRLPPQGSGQTFTILPPKGAGQIELGIYNAKIAAGLEKYGWRQVDRRSAQYAVGYEYGVSGPQQFTTNLPLMGQTGGGTTYHSGTVNTYAGGQNISGSFSGTSYTPATYGVVGSIPITQTAYDRWLLIIAKDRHLNDVFEMRCKSLGTLSEISRVLPHMIDSAFAEFPGVSGKTKTYHRVREN